MQAQLLLSCCVLLFTNLQFTSKKRKIYFILNIAIQRTICQKYILPFNIVLQSKRWQCDRQTDMPRNIERKAVSLLDDYIWAAGCWLIAYWLFTCLLKGVTHKNTAFSCLYRCCSGMERTQSIQIIYSVSLILTRNIFLYVNKRKRWRMYKIKLNPDPNCIPSLYWRHVYSSFAIWTFNNRLTFNQDSAIFWSSLWAPILKKLNIIWREKN